jgi:DNA polymerase-3 subunit alpha
MNGTVNGFACVRSVHQHRTKKGDMMAFLKLYDETGEIEMAVMPRLWQQCAQFLLKGTYIRFCAKISPERSLLADRIEIMNQK